MILASNFQPSGPVVLSKSFQDILVAQGVPANVVEALTKACNNVNDKMDRSAFLYARSMELSYSQFGVPGVSMQVAYLMMYMNRWTGDEARECKKVLRKWTAE